MIPYGIFFFQPKDLELILIFNSDFIHNKAFQKTEQRVSAFKKIWNFSKLYSWQQLKLNYEWTVKLLAEKWFNEFYAVHSLSLNIYL